MGPVDTGLSGKGVLVTGGAGGIGSACVRAFAAEGARVAVHYNTSRDQAEELAAETGGTPLQADLTDEAAVEQLFAAAREALGQVDVCAAVGRRLASRRRARLAAAARALARDRRREPDRDLPHRARLPARGRAQRPRQPRPRRLDRRAFRRGGPRRLRRRESGDPGRPAAQPEERDRPDRAARARQRGRARLDLLADDARRARPRARRAADADDGPAQGRRRRGRRPCRRRARLGRALRARHRRARDGGRRHGRTDRSTPETWNGARRRRPDSCRRECRQSAAGSPSRYRHNHAGT